MYNLINFFFPSKCLFCDHIGNLICNSCLASIPINCGLFNQQLSSNDPNGPIIKLVSLFGYSGIPRDCIKVAKYGKRYFSVLHALTLHGLTTPNFVGDFTGFILVPIPISEKRAKERGFNQAEVIANILAKKYKLRVNTKNLVRIKDTKPQFGLTKPQRIQNISGAFCVKQPHLLKGQKVLLVDDVCTSGSTFLEAGKVLLASGAKEVCGFSLCRD